jgi:aspartyl-tRNA(Asn)/glutamyl-tRNA(Gln) amidotransferase subunit B
MMNDAKSKPRELAEKHSLIQKSNAADLIPAIEKVLSDNPKVVTEYKAGKTASLQFLIGQAMKATKGAGNPEVVKKLLLEKLS